MGDSIAAKKAFEEKQDKDTSDFMGFDLNSKNWELLADIPRSFAHPDTFDEPCPFDLTAIRDDDESKPFSEAMRRAKFDLMPLLRQRDQKDYLACIFGDASAFGKWLVFGFGPSSYVLHHHLRDGISDLIEKTGFNVFRYDGRMDERDFDYHVFRRYESWRNELGEWQHHGISFDPVLR